MNGKAFIRGFLEKLGLSMGIGAGPTASMTPPPVGGMLKQRKPKVGGVTMPPVGSTAPMKIPVPTPIG